MHNEVIFYQLWHNKWIFNSCRTQWEARSSWTHALLRMQEIIKMSKILTWVDPISVWRCNRSKDCNALNNHIAAFCIINQTWKGTKTRLNNLTAKTRKKNEQFNLTCSKQGGYSNLQSWPASNLIFEHCQSMRFLSGTAGCTLALYYGIFATTIHLDHQ